MFDIFEDVKPQPRLYIADIEILFTYKRRKNSKNIEENRINLKKYPVVLANKEFPTEKTKNNILKRIFQIYGRGEYDKSKIKVLSIKNCKYSSDLAYKFNYNIH